MAVQKIATFTHPILKQVCEPIFDFDEELSILIQDMKDTLSSTKNGVGLAAPQIGVTKQVILVGDQAIINPTIAQHNGHQIINEGCLSYPNIFKTVKRPYCVTVVGKTETGADFQQLYEGIYAAIACHEIDHLHGNCIIGQKKAYSKSKKAKQNN